MSGTEVEIYGATCIKWPTNLKSGKKQERYIELWGYIDPNGKDSSFLLKYYQKAGGAMKGEIKIDKETSVKLLDFEEARSQGINSKLGISKDQWVLFLSTVNTDLYFRDVRPTRQAQQKFLDEIEKAIEILRSPLLPLSTTNPQNQANPQSQETLEELKTTTIEKEKELKEKQDNSEEVVKENSDSNEAGGSEKEGSEKEGSEKEGSEKEEIPVGEEKKDGNTNEDKDINEDKTNDNDKSNDTKLGNASESDENQNEVNELNAVNVDKEDTQEIAEIITEKNENELKTDQLEAIEKTLIDKPTLQGYGYFTETASKTDLFYIIDIAQKVLFAYDYKQMDLFSNVAVEETLTEVERTPTSSYNFANGSVEVSRVSYTSLHSESAIKISFTETEVVLILCPSNSESKQREEEFFYALKDVCVSENIEIPAPPSNGCCTIV